MVNTPFWEEVNRQIRDATGTDFQGRGLGDVGGGCISQANRLVDQTTDQAYFIKQNRAELLDMFQTEAMGLAQIANTETIRVPKPVCWGLADGTAFLVLEWLDLGHSGSYALMGEQLAALHACRPSQQFGWDRSNYIGATKQVNARSENWSHFFLEQRLDYQVSLAGKRRLARYDELRRALPDILSHQPSPSLVHGDLWSGNASFTKQGEPVIYDVAAYYGDREVDLAMSELFGGFSRDFYLTYAAALPLTPGYERRRTLYNLYHVLNHYNLFGGHYLGQANRMIAELLN